MRKDNTQNYQTPYSRIQHFKNFDDNKGQEKSELKKIKRSYVNNEDDVHNLPNLKKYKNNRVTNKIDDSSKDEVEDKIEVIDIDEPKHVYRIIDKNESIVGNYDMFVFESALNESVVVYSDTFRDILGNIDSPIADALKDIETEDLKVSNNYIDIGDDKEQISFISDRKAQELIKSSETKVTYNGNGGFLRHSDSNSEIFAKLGYVPNGESVYHPSDGEEGEVESESPSSDGTKTYAKVNFKGGVSVLNIQSLSKFNAASELFDKNRQSIRIGRGVRSLLTAKGVKFTDSEIEVFVNKYKSEYDKLNDIFRYFELVEGDAIAHWYNKSNYSGSKGTLSSSCMSNVDSEFFDIYVLNPTKCKLLILKSEDDKSLIRGRSLIWFLDTPADVIFMDRIYTHDESDVEVFREYSKFKGWSYKEYNTSSSDSPLINSEGESNRYSGLVVHLSRTSYEKYPYLDTMKYLDTSTGNLTNSDDGYRGSLVNDDIILLEDTDGGYERAESCDRCGGDGEIECSTCDGSSEVDCFNCDGSGNIECSRCDGETKVQCTTCDGRGKFDCDECDATGEKECDDCNGNGTDDNGDECSNCSGSGKVKCDDCDGDGESECTECDGDGDVECTKCDGDGETECGYCDGNGKTECDDCSNGRVDCPECT